MSERGVTVDHSTLNRWVIKYAPEIERQFRRCQHPVGRSWRMDESVPRTHSQRAGVRCYMEDEGRLLGAGVQAQAPNHLTAVFKWERPDSHNGETTRECRVG